jgi:hypothetical protein
MLLAAGCVRRDAYELWMINKSIGWVINKSIGWVRRVVGKKLEDAKLSLRREKNGKRVGGYDGGCFLRRDACDGLRAGAG